MHVALVLSLSLSLSGTSMFLPFYLSFFYFVCNDYSLIYLSTYLLLPVAVKVENRYNFVLAVKVSIVNNTVDIFNMYISIFGDKFLALVVCLIQVENIYKCSLFLVPYIIF